MAAPLPVVTVGGAPPVPPALRRAAAGFEEMFLSQLLRDFTAGAIGPGGTGSEAFASMLQDEYARMISRGGGVGIADAVTRTLLGRRGSA
jgi:Rod binding domain-containing protein